MLNSGSFLIGVLIKIRQTGSMITKPRPENILVLKFNAVSLEYPNIIEIGMCSIVGEQIERPFSVLVNPGFAYTIGPNSKHNITYDHVKHLPMFDAVEETLMAEIWRHGGNVAVYGFGFIKRCFDASFSKKYRNMRIRWIDVLSMARTSLSAPYSFPDVIEKLDIYCDDHYKAGSVAFAIAEAYLKLSKMPSIPLRGLPRSLDVRSIP